MAKCAVCGKAAHFGNNVSHSHRKSNRMWKSNIKSVKCKVNGTPKRLYVCTSCLRSGKVERAQYQLGKTFIFDEETNKKTVLFYRAVFFVVLTGSKTDCSR